MTTDLQRIVRRVFTFIATFLCSLSAAPAQQPQPTVSSPSDSIKLTVVVDTKASQPVTNLAPQDFTILDNRFQRPITSFKIVSAAEEPVHVILFIDAVNTPFDKVEYVRQGVEKFLRQNEGKLAYPTELAVLTDEGVKTNNVFSTDGNALNDVLEHHEIGLREINRASQWGGQERLQICLNAFHQLLSYSSALPGRKIILWISPGWPLLSGPFAYLDSKQERQIFSTIVSFSAQMRQSNITLYNVNPIGVQESMVRADYYQAFLNGVAKPGEVQFGNLGIQVLAIQSGGLALESSNDVAGNIQKSLSDVQSWYEITFDPSPADKPNEYHQIQIKLDKPGLVARTRTGYYSNPQILAP
jgi:VWFA-related protein